MSESNQFEMPATSPTPETPPTPSAATAPVAMVVAPQQPQRPAPSQQAQWQARGLAGGGALLFAIAAWSPWVAAAGTSAGVADRQPSFTLYLDPAVIAAPPLDGLFGRSGALFVWSALTVLGILLQPLLWQGAGWVRRAALAAFALWLAITIVVCIISAVTLAQYLGSGSTAGGVPRHLTLLPTEQPFDVLDGQLGVGMPLAVGALALAVWGLVALFSTDRRAGIETASAEALGARALRHLPGAGMLTAGVLLWELGTLAFPWATVNCNAVPLFFGSCTGLPFSGVVGYGIHTTFPFLDALVALHAVGLLLAGGALLLLVGLWRHASSHMLAGWAVAWIATASFLVVLASAGIQLVSSRPTSLGLARGNWSGDSGIFVALLGLALALVAAVWLWGARLLPQRT